MDLVIDEEPSSMKDCLIVFKKLSDNSARIKRAYRVLKSAVLFLYYRRIHRGLNAFRRKIKNNRENYLQFLNATTRIASLQVHLRKKQIRRAIQKLVDLLPKNKQAKAHRFRIVRLKSSCFGAWIVFTRDRVQESIHADQVANQFYSNFRKANHLENLRQWTLSHRSVKEDSVLGARYNRMCLLAKGLANWSNSVFAAMRGRAFQSKFSRILKVDPLANNSRLYTLRRAINYLCVRSRRSQCQQSVLVRAYAPLFLSLFTALRKQHFRAETESRNSRLASQHHRMRTLNGSIGMISLLLFYY